jgi:hypothetical protein
MSNANFTAASTSKLTSTTSSQTVAIPIGYSALEVYNAGANMVYLKFAASVAVPSSSFADGVLAVQAGTTQVFSIPPGQTTLAYIAETAGGPMVLSVGEGS